MSETAVLSQKFTITYDYADGSGDKPKAGFLDYVSGHPSFSAEPANHYLRDTIAEALKDALMVETTMQTFCGHEKVYFHTIRVVRWKTVIETIDDINAAVIDELVNLAKSKLAEDEQED